MEQPENNSSRDEDASSDFDEQLLEDELEEEQSGDDNANVEGSSFKSELADMGFDCEALARGDFTNWSPQLKDYYEPIVEDATPGLQTSIIPNMQSEMDSDLAGAETERLRG